MASAKPPPHSDGGQFARFRLLVRETNDIELNDQLRVLARHILELIELQMVAKVLSVRDVLSRFKFLAMRYPGVMAEFPLWLNRLSGVTTVEMALQCCRNVEPTLREFFPPSSPPPAT